MADFFLGDEAIDTTSDFIKNPTTEALENRILIINQEIDDRIIEMYAYHIIKWNMEDIGIPVERRKPIRIFLNSPGGDCIVGFGLINVIQQSKTPVWVIGTGLVASMAFYLFLGCHKRIAFNDTVFLMHDGSMMVANSSSKAKDTMKFFDEMNERTKQFVLGVTNIDSDFYDDHYDQEYYCYADKAKELGCVDAIVGQDITLEETFA